MFFSAYFCIKREISILLCLSDTAPIVQHVVVDIPQLSELALRRAVGMSKVERVDVNTLII